MKNDFKSDLQFSHTADSLPIWDEIYFKAFPGCTTKNNREDGQLQRYGIDRTVVLESGKAIYIDEKVRRKDYGDILLEYISNDTTKTPGWVCKPLFCDYIAYAIIPAEKCFLLPVPQLQKAWLDNKEVWFKKFCGIGAVNNGYKTLSLCIPVNDLFKAIGNTLRISFSNIGCE